VNVRVKVGFRPQPGPQTSFVESPCDITVYGGARGGGKTYATLGEWYMHALKHGDKARGLMIRKTREDLKDTIAVATSMYQGAATWTEKGSFFKFTNGARLYCAYLEREQDAEHYQGWSLTRVYVEELTQFVSPSAVMRLLATLRSPHGIKCQMRCTCNPGGPGHLWVREWAIDHGAYEVVTDPDTGLKRTFIPALLSDNLALMEQDPEYVNRLRAVGSPQLVRAWLEGDWSVIEGAFFPEWSTSRHVISPMHIPPEWVRFRAADWGSARPFSIGWYAVVQDDMVHDGKLLKRKALVRYREWYGSSGKPNDGLRLTVEEVANSPLFPRSEEHLLRTLPVMTHDIAHPEDMDTEGEDHAVDELRYACMSRPFSARIDQAASKNPFLVANAFRLHELED
jgi:hypothetical protein